MYVPHWTTSTSWVLEPNRTEESHQRADRAAILAPPTDIPAEHAADEDLVVYGEVDDLVDSDTLGGQDAVQLRQKGTAREGQGQRGKKGDERAEII